VPEERRTQRAEAIYFERKQPLFALNSWRMIIP
jgi:hypothetical protein